ncbi:hypothetical protein RF11_04077 [Thelohanellus kitauei]|uniref:Uncharacterized protein n=1 Tax=Thelohanellus kitauei TaxID=669202 RepID=A0A0C2IVT6_THEKT|nr:hypothetical protein RF11_04077 [Thelohanellus kitauei]
MKETTTSEDIFEFMENNLHKIVLPLHKMANITTDSSLSLIGKTVGLLKRMCDSVAEVDSNEEWIFLHDIIHQECTNITSTAIATFYMCHRVILGEDTLLRTVRSYDTKVTYVCWEAIPLILASAATSRDLLALARWWNRHRLCCVAHGYRVKELASSQNSNGTYLETGLSSGVRDTKNQLEDADVFTKYSNAKDEYKKRELRGRIEVNKTVDRGRLI